MSDEDEGFSTATRPALLDGRPALVYTYCRLTVSSGPAKGQVLDAERDLIRVGAAEDNDLVLRDPAVSRYHFEIRRRGGAFVLVDVGSRNGTFVGSMQIGEATLRRPTEITLGDSVLVFEPLSTSVEVVPSGQRVLGGLVGDSLEMREIFTIVQRVAPTELTILVTGETGTGKELVARAIHQNSRREGGPFVTLACGALPPALIESALFGHEAGSRDGALTHYAGAFEAAHGGTLFLDELGELPLELQPRILRAIERGEIQRLGSHELLRVDVRLVAAAAVDIQARAQTGAFRDDLYYRLAEVRIDVPPLRNRPGDLPALIDHFFAIHREEIARVGAPARGLSPSALNQLRKYDYKGNVRELHNILRRAVAAAREPEIQLADLPIEVTGRRASQAPRPREPGSMLLPDASMPFKDAKAQVLDAFERQYLEDLIERHRMNISKAAREAGIDRRHLYRLLDKYGIEIKDRPSDDTC